MNFNEAAHKNLGKIEAVIEAKHGLQDKIWIVAGYLLVGAALVYLLYDFTRTNWFHQSIKLFMVIGIAGGISWSIKIAHIIRIVIYRKWILPRILTQPDDPRWRVQELFVVVPTYMEKDWITYAVFRAISRETAKIDIPVTIVVDTPDDNDTKNIHDTLVLFPLKENVKLVTLKQGGKGKRNALAESLKYIQSLGRSQNAVVALMDGDCIWGKDLLHNVLPVFSKNPHLGGVTTNEELICFGSLFYEKWFDYRLAFRDFYMSSHSVSRRVLCLTGRFSVVRGEIATMDDFIRMVEHDNMDHWLWGNVKFLGGDDKSTWFWIFKNGRQIEQNELLYLPDALVYTLECIKENGFIRSQKNLKRWFTNTARNNTRSLMMTPVKQVPLFIWLCILGQRITMYSNFLGITTALALGCLVDWIFIPAFLYLCLFEAILVTVIFSINRKRFLYWGPYIQLINQWVGTFIKMWAFSHIAEQKWAHRGGQKMGVGGKSLLVRAKLAYAKYEFFLKIIFVVILVLFVTGVINPIRDVEVLIGK